MKRGVRLFPLSVLFIFILLTTSWALTDQPYHLKLLAVQEVNGDYQGSEADLYLELKPGSGRVFLETYPLTKLDTQISTRFAKDIACNHFKLNCDKYDFFYTINAKSNIIGGPSAGAAISALTAIAVMGLEYDSNIAVTGTINSGGIIGPIGGVDGKLEAASQAGLKKVLVAYGSAEDFGEEISVASITNNINDNITTNTNNTNIANISTSGNNTNYENATITTNSTSNQNSSVIAYGKTLGVEVIEVIDLDEVLFHLTGKQFNGQVYEIVENPEYSQIMQHLQELLCRRTSKITAEVQSDQVHLNQTVWNEINTTQAEAQNSTVQGDYYSAASFCFGNNIYLKTQYYQQKQITSSTYERLFLDLEKKSWALEQEIDLKKIDTISSLQAYMVVKERLNDVKKQIQKFRTNVTIEESAALLAYSEERYFSVLSWMEFFKMDGKKFVVDTELLKTSCIQKTSEAEERHQYAELFLGEINLQRIQEKILSAKEALNTNQSALCLITAAQAKAEANAILSALGLVDENLGRFLESKKKAVERVIAENNQEGIFPILGYSYYQYGNSLQEEKYNALVYYEYALEMSDLSLYFPEEKNYFASAKNFTIDEKWWYLGIGLLVGLVLMWFVTRKRTSKNSV